MILLDTLYFLVLALSGFVKGFVGGMVGLVLGIVRFPIVREEHRKARLVLPHERILE